MDLKLFGINISSKSTDLEKSIQRCVEEGIGHVQVYVEPGTTEDDLKPLVDTGLVVIVHAAHSFHGFNPSDGLSERNVQTIEEAMKAAEFLRAYGTVFHHGNYHPKEGLLDRGINDRIDAFYDFIGNYPRTGRLIFETMPQFEANGNVNFFSSPLNIFDEVHQRYGIEVCLDLASAITNAYNPFGGMLKPERRRMVPGFDMWYDSKGNLDPMSQRLMDQEVGKATRRVQEYLNRGVVLVHTRGVDIWDVHRYNQPMSPMNDLIHEMVFPYCEERSVPIILEGTMKGKGVWEYVAHVKELMKRIAT